jgi:hypothetical protein
MMRNGYAAVSATVFTIVALLQFWRAAKGIPVEIGHWPLPVVASWVAGTLAAVLALWGWRTKGRSR